ncbi:GNAT family N-acetyltransferase [Actinopolymorpha pittospori]|uniref:GNAT superfamily N-acetyltransferase n=1 Tax=Actinopolymorpha pittospori TaxID=648752 RepID=A0A927MQV0_9ACTN|nr:GNAT superfamily N-acetyltransferase [Actinopolymorpha pittospori]
MALTNDHVEAAVRAYADTCESLARAATTGRARRGPRGAVLAISGAPVASLNAIISPALEPDADEIADLADSAKEAGFPWSIQVRGEPTPLVTEVAAAHGLTRRNAMPLMIRWPDEGPPPQSDHGALRVRAVPADQLGAYTRLLEDGFEAPHGTFEVMASPSLAEMPGITFYLAEVDGVPVGTGMASVSEDLLGIFNITTLPRYRRRGYGRALTLEIAREGYVAGATTAYLYASKMGARVYESAGFRTEEHLTAISA